MDDLDIVVKTFVLVLTLSFSDRLQIGVDLDVTHRGLIQLILPLNNEQPRVTIFVIIFIYLSIELSS